MNKCIYCESKGNIYICRNPKSMQCQMGTRCTKAKHECNQFKKDKKTMSEIEEPYDFFAELQKMTIIVVVISTISILLSIINIVNNIWD